MLTRPSFSTGYARNASESANPNLWKGLVGAWTPSFGVTGGTLKDISGNDNDGTLISMDVATDWVGTSKGLALDFEINQRVIVPHNTKVDVKKQLTVTVLCKPSVNRNSWTALAYKNVMQVNGSYHIGIDPSNNLAGGVKDGTWRTVQTSASVAAGSWHYVAMTIDENLQEITFYKNGKIVYQSAWTWVMNGNNYPLTIASNGGLEYFYGQIGFVSLHNRVLSPAEIKQLYLNPAAPFQKKTVVAGFVPKTFHKVAVLKKPEPSFVNGYARNASESARPHLWKGLVGAWAPSLGVTGDTLRDVSGNGNDGTLTNMDPATDWVATSKGLALDFDGSDDYVTTDDSEGLFARSGDDPLTVSCWVYPKRFSGYQDIVGNRDDHLSFNFLLYQHTSGGSIQLHGSSQYKSNYVPPYQKWTHICATVGSNTCRVYANAKLVHGPFYYTYWSANPTKLNFGAYSTSAGGQNENFLGGLSNILIYHRALSPSEIKELFIKPLAPFERKSTVVGAPAPPPPPVTNYKAVKVIKSHIKPSFKTGYARNASESANPNLRKGLVGAWMPSFGVTGGTLKDVSGNGNDGTLQFMDAATDWVATSKGLALDFDGVNDYVLSESIKHDVGTGDFSWSVWFYPTAGKVSGATLSPFCGINEYYPTFGWDLNNNANQLGFYWSGWFGFGLYPNLNEWNHAVLVRKNYLMIGYLNGVSSLSGNRTQSMANGRIVLGRSGVSYGADKFTGKLNDFYFYNRALSAPEIKQLYLNPSAPFEMKDTFAAYKDPLPPVRGLFRLP